MRPLGSEKRDQLVYEQLLDNIKNGTWKSGDKLPSEMELCGSLNVSRGTVRSAVQKLVSVGLVESKHGKGTYVCHNEDLFDYSGFKGQIIMTPSEYQDITQLREAIEKQSVQNIIEAGTCSENKAIAEAYHHMEEAASRFDSVDLTKFDMMFHTAIILASKNQLFVQIIRIFHDQYYTMLLETNKLLMRDYPNKTLMKEHFDECLVNHKHLMDALKNNTSKAMQEQEKFHARNKERVEYYFKKNSDGIEEK